MTSIDTFFALLVFLAAIPAIVCLCIEQPKIIPLFFIIVLFTFSDSTWGQLKIEGTIYGRGSGLLNFSILEIILLTSGFAFLIRKLANPHHSRLAVPHSHYFNALVVLLLAHILVGTHLRVDIFTILSNSGIINILNMMIFMYMVIMAFNKEKDEKRMLYVIIFLAGCRAVFGLIRFFLFDGDSANPYRNFDGFDTKILFFDIGDNFVASLAAFWAAWMLTASEKRITLAKRAGLYLFLAAEVAVVALSFRRSSLIGLGLMFLFLLFRISGTKRLKLILLGLCILSVSAFIFFQKRLQFANAGGNILSAFVFDISPDKASSNRLYELMAAARSLGENWLVGLGTWGTYTGDADILSYHQEKHFNFIHSGFGHIVLKTGIIGLAIFLGIIANYTRSYFRHQHSLTGNARLLSDAGFAGFLFWLPTLLIGTPIIEYRTMLLIGLTLAMPFIATNLKSRRAVSHAIA